MIPATWGQELDLIGAEAGGDMGFLCALVALRRTENGEIGDETHPSKAFGVLSVPAPTYQDQLRVAASSIRHHIARCHGMVVKDPLGFFTVEFLTSFSHHWAPVGADNDPSGTNANHAANLIRIAGDMRSVLTVAIYSFPQ